VYSLEHDAEYAEKTRRLLDVHGLGKFATVIHAPLTSYKLPGWNGDWYSLATLPLDLKIDMLSIDGPPWFVASGARYPAIPLLYERFSDGIAIFLDDADRPDEQAAVLRWTNEFPRLSKLAIPACEKGCAALKLELNR
jgi:hypothetical protein